MGGVKGSFGKTKPFQRNVSNIEEIITLDMSQKLVNILEELGQYDQYSIKNNVKVLTLV